MSDAHKLTEGAKPTQAGRRRRENEQAIEPGPDESPDQGASRDTERALAHGLTRLPPG